MIRLLSILFTLTFCIWRTASRNEDARARISDSPQFSDEKNDCSNRKDIVAPRNIRTIVKRAFPEFKIASVSDFYEEWCSFYRDNEVPYLVSGDYNGNGDKEYAAILTTKNRTKTILVLIGNNKAIVLDTLAFMANTKSTNTEASQTRFTYGLFTDGPGEIYDFTTDSTFNVKTENLRLSYFEKAAKTYFWTGKKYRRIHSGD